MSAILYTYPTHFYTLSLHDALPIYRIVGVALETDVERLVVGDEFGAKREHEQHHEDMERPVAAPVGLEVLPAPAIDRRECEKTRSEEHTSELQSPYDLVCRLLLEKK